MKSHPLLRTLLAAADNVFPPVDGVVEFLPELAPDLQAVVSFTGHAFIATNLAQREFIPFRLDGFGSALQPKLLRHLAGPYGYIGSVDLTLVARGVGGGRLPTRTDLEGHPRVRRALRLRQRVRVFGDDRGLLTLSEGLAGRLEMSVEAAPKLQGSAAGRALIAEGLRLVPAGAKVYAAVAPGNARSVRAFLALGFRPLGSEILIEGPLERASVDSEQQAAQ